MIKIAVASGPSTEGRVLQANLGEEYLGAALCNSQR